jgi:anti-sigma regulatory factor (Ser/Thr protein kinase)
MPCSFKKDLTALAGIFSFLEQELASRHASSATVYIVSLAVEELFTNMVKYSSPGAGTVAISVATVAGSCRIVMEECGVDPFDPTAAGEVDLTRHTEVGQPGGLGLHLVRHLVDNLHHDYRNQCNVITFTKGLES